MLKMGNRILISIFLVMLCVGCGREGSQQVDNQEGHKVINDNLPDRVGYTHGLHEVTPVEVDIEALADKVKSHLGRQPKILISMLHNTNDWNLLVSSSAIQAGRDMNADVTLTNAEGNWNQQVSHIEEGIEKGMDAIVITGGISRSLQEVIKKGAQAGIPIITIDIPSPYVLTNVTSDNYTGAAMLSMKMALDMEGQGNIVVIHSPGWHTIEIRRRILDEVLKDWPGIHIIKEKPVDEEDAINGSYSIMKSILKEYPKPGSIKGVYTVFGLNGIGAARAIEDAGRSGDIAVYTTDADSIVLDDMLKEDGAIKGCIGQTTPQLGYTATIQAMKGICGDTEDIYKQTFCPITLITKENAEEVKGYLYGPK